jgi:type III secretory pathway component EscU
MSAMVEPLHILVAGPYRSGTGDDPVKIQANVDAMSDTALRLFRAGHLPVLGEWYALPLIEGAGSREIGDEIFDEIFHPVARRLVAKCDAVLRIGGPSAGADDMVATAKAHGKRVFMRIEDVPGCA